MFQPHTGIGGESMAFAEGRWCSLVEHSRMICHIVLPFVLNDSVTFTCSFYLPGGCTVFIDHQRSTHQHRGIRGGVGVELNIDLPKISRHRLDMTIYL